MWSEASVLCQGGVSGCLEALLTIAVYAGTSALWFFLSLPASAASLGLDRKSWQTSTPDSCCLAFLCYSSWLGLGFEVLCEAPAPNFSSIDQLHSVDRDIDV